MTRSHHNGSQWVLTNGWCTETNSAYVSGDLGAGLGNHVTFNHKFSILLLFFGNKFSDQNIF